MSMVVYFSYYFAEAALIEWLDESSLLALIAAVPSVDQKNLLVV